MQECGIVSGISASGGGAREREILERRWVMALLGSGLLWRSTTSDVEKGEAALDTDCGLEVVEASRYFTVFTDTVIWCVSSATRTAALRTGTAHCQQPQPGILC